MSKVKVRKIGNSLGVILPKNILDILGIGEGEEIEIDVEEGTVRIVLRNKKK